MKAGARTRVSGRTAIMNGANAPAAPADPQTSRENNWSGTAYPAARPSMAGAGERDLSVASGVTVTAPAGLSVRAENVLKVLAPELTGEQPPRGRWTPSDLLVQRLTYQSLVTARNCGPRTTAEIIEWARQRGKDIRRPVHAGKSLSAMWHDITARSLAGEVPKVEVAEALENSTRRRNTRIPVTFQRMLLELVRSPEE